MAYNPRLANPCPILPWDFLLWEADYKDACKDLATRNAPAGVACTAYMLLGTEDYQDEAQKLYYQLGLSAQIQSAALKAWKCFPLKKVWAWSWTFFLGAVDSPVTPADKIIWLSDNPIWVTQ